MSFWPFTITRRGAIRRVLARLPARLRQDYGGGGPYTPQQVVRSLERSKLAPRRFWPYALAIFCDRDSVEQLERRDAGGRSYDELRAVVSDTFFGGEFEFTAADIGRYEAHGEHGGGHSGHGGAEHSGHHGDGGGHH